MASVSFHHVYFDVMCTNTHAIHYYFANLIAHKIPKISDNGNLISRKISLILHNV